MSKPKYPSIADAEKKKHQEKVARQKEADAKRVKANKLKRNPEVEKPNADHRAPNPGDPVEPEVEPKQDSDSE